MEINLTVKNVKCGGCVSNIENGLKDMHGIEAVDVNIDTGNVNIKGNELNQTEISTKLSELGYPEI